jgi:YbgC/YbaW family acyl-CoA thioester hydrolase
MMEPPADTPVTETEIVVRGYELDSFGHVNHAVFLNYFEHGRFDALRRGGLSRAEMERRRWGVYVVRVEIDYLAEARQDDRLVVRTRAEGFKRTSMVLAQEMVRPSGEREEVLARARVHAVWVGADRRPMRVPAEVRAALG